MTLALVIPGLLMGGGDGGGSAPAPTLKTQQGAGG